MSTTINVDVELSLRCNKCNGELDAPDQQFQNGNWVLDVDPCTTCLIEKGDSEYERGFKRGLVDAATEGAGS